MLELAVTRLAGSAGSRTLLLVGPSLGTSATALWSRAAGHLTDVEVLGWDLPGHGRSPIASSPFDVADLAEAVAAIATRHERGCPVRYAGVSLAGIVGLACALTESPFSAVAVLAAAPRIGAPDAWRERAALVRRESTSAVVTGSRERWFAPGFAQSELGVAEVLLESLRATDDESYALACEALARFDISGRTRSLVVPVLAMTGTLDPVIDAAQVRALLPTAEHIELPDCGHLPPAEQPVEVAALLDTWFAEGEVA